MAGHSETRGQRPSHSVRVGAVEAAIWRNERRDGVGFYSVTFKRSFKDDTRGWQESSSFGERECLVLARVALEAQAWIRSQGRSHAESPEPA